MRVLRSERLRMTPVTAGNADILWRVLQQPGLRDYQDLPNLGMSAFRDLVSRRPKELRLGVAGRFEWIVFRHGGRRAIGWVSLRIAEREPGVAEIGYTILSEARGNGLATEAVRALITEAFERAGVDRVRAYCVEANAPSRRLLMRLGFRPDGILHHGASVSGRTVDVLSHVMDRSSQSSEKSMEMPAFA
jgi:RimJ/RimL family protein N-acetyltransferase